METNFRRGSFRRSGVRSIRFAERPQNLQDITGGRKALSLLKNVDEDGTKAIEPCGIPMSAFERSRMKCIPPQTNLFESCGGDRAVRPKPAEEFGHSRSGVVQG